jgi:hypothetical protein
MAVDCPPLRPPDLLVRGAGRMPSARRHRPLRSLAVLAVLAGACLLAVGAPAAGGLGSAVGSPTQVSGAWTLVEQASAANDAPVPVVAQPGSVVLGGQISLNLPGRTLNGTVSLASALPGQPALTGPVLSPSSHMAVVVNLGGVRCDGEFRWNSDASPGQTGGSLRLTCADGSTLQSQVLMDTVSAPNRTYWQWHFAGRLVNGFHIDGA